VLLEQLEEMARGGVGSVEQAKANSGKLVNGSMRNWFLCLSPNI
jgi:hypothetical protein